MVEHISLGVVQSGEQAFDLDFQNNSFVEVQKRAELRQAILLRALENKGDWYYNRDEGLPWIPHEFSTLGSDFAILGSKPPMPLPLIKLFINDEFNKERKRFTISELDVGVADRPKRLYSASMNVIPVNEAPFRVVINV